MSRLPAADERTVLSRELSVFLVQFSIALHKHATYPPGHPSLATALESVLDRLADLLRDRELLSIGISRQQLLIEGVATDPANPVLRELAQRLHRQQLGAIRLMVGIEATELGEVLTILGPEPLAETKPLGLRPAEELNRYAHVKLVPMAFDQLSIAEDGAPPPEQLGRGQELWLSLAAAALIGTGSDGQSDESLDPTVVAREINRRGENASYDRVIVSYLLELGRELKVAEGAAATMLRNRVAALLGELKPEVLNRLLETGADISQRRQLLLDTAPVLPVRAVLDLLKAASGSSQQTISHALLRILGKLAQNVEIEGPVKIRAEGALRDVVQQLVTGWTLADPNPGGYTAVLERLSRAGHDLPERPDVDDPGEGLRVVQTSLEVGFVGEATWHAMDEMIERLQTGNLIELLDRPPPVASAEDIEACWAHLATPHCVRRLLLHEQQDPQGIDRLLTRMGMAAAEPMLEALEVADSRAVRRRLLTRLSALGPGIGPLVVPRLVSAPWFVQRNMLALLGTLPELPGGFTPVSYADHTDGRVRREAIKLLIRNPAQREDGIGRALADEDDQILRMGLAAVSESCPPSAVTRLMTLLNDRSRDPEVRALGIRALTGLRTPSVRSWLLSHAVIKGGWFRRSRLAPRSPELLAILGVLAVRWKDDPLVVPVLKLADASTDPDVRAAAKGAVGA
ncbi:MAG TPA: hypothetical protein VJN95_16855 [Gemmatimonadales bacterium]|nr:hypothetical protein [Gemmatimonadales bacterium]